MSVEENKALVRREQAELWNHTGNLDAAAELFAPDRVEDAKQEAASVRRGFPDLELPSIGWQLFILDSSQSDPITLPAFLDTYATRLLTEPLREDPPEQPGVVQHQAVGVHRQVRAKPAVETHEPVGLAPVAHLQAGVALRLRPGLELGPLQVGDRDLG